MWTLTSPKGHDTSPEISRVEGHVDARKRNGSETALKFDVTFSFLKVDSPLMALLHDVTEHLFDLLDREGFGQLIQSISSNNIVKTGSIP